MIDSSVRRIQVFSEPHISTTIWLTQLRWIAVAGQLLVIGFVWFVLRVPLPIVPMFILVAVTAASNTALWLWAKQLQRESSMNPRLTNVARRDAKPNYDDDSIGVRAIGVLLAVDVITLSALLYCSGGAANPFTFFYFANIAIAGMILPRIWAWGISLLTILGCLVLLNRAFTLEVFEQSALSPQAEWGITKFAFLIAFATCCAVVTYFVSMLAMELRFRETELAQVEQQRERSQRLEALATLAAGAGHELASPLSTIAVVAKELSRNLDKTDAPPSVRRDVDLIRQELNRCKEILHRMKSGAGEAAAENMHPVSIREIVNETVTAMREPQRVDVVMPPEMEKRQGLLPKQALSQALRNLLQNGLDASKLDQHVQLHVMAVDKDGSSTEDVWLFTITDQGAGMSDEVQRRIGEPFFTTKDVGQGMGLGVFLTRNVIQGLGGELRFEPTPAGGTICRVTLPIRE
ncbi:MAG: HAMP domain-containing sensor histidine kinase [Pirellula sp.]